MQLAKVSRGPIQDLAYTKKGRTVSSARRMRRREGWAVVERTVTFRETVTQVEREMQQSLEGNGNWEPQISIGNGLGVLGFWYVVSTEACALDVRKQEFLVESGFFRRIKKVPRDHAL
jgi:hypothetical protein